MTATETTLHTERGVYVLPDGTRLPRVTTILNGGLPGGEGGLTTWYAQQAAQEAWRVRKDWAAADTITSKSLYEWVAGAGQRALTAAGDFGTAVHDHIEADILGTAMPTPADDDADLRASLTAYQAFVADWQPEWEATELTVANRDVGYAGRFDAIGRFPCWPGENVLVDWKTSKSVSAKFALQLNAYHRAREGYLRDGTPVDVPECTRAVVVHIRPDAVNKRTGAPLYPTGYGVYPVALGDTPWQQFLAAKKAHADMSYATLMRNIGRPLTQPPATTLDIPGAA